MPELLAQPRATDLSRPLTGAAVVSVGMAVPDRVVSNDEVGSRLGVTSDWIRERTGIEERREAGPKEELLDFAERASRIALERGGVSPAEIDLILVATTTYPEIMPSASAMLGQRLGAPLPAAMDIGAACNGFVAALDLAAAQIESGRARNVLLVGVDLMRSIVEETDRGTAIVFGDGAGACLVCAVEGQGRISSFVRGSDGNFGHLIRASQIERRIEMMGHETFREAVDRLAQITVETVEAAGTSFDEIDLFVYHQANSRILRAVGERINLPADRVANYIAAYGNTSAGSIPITLAEAESDGKLREGSRVLVAAFGSGLTWGATILDWGRGGKS